MKKDWDTIRMLIKNRKLIVSLFKLDGTAEIFEIESACRNGPAIQFNIKEEPKP